MVVERFNVIYLGDSVLKNIELKLVSSECILTFHAGKVLRAADASIFEPVAAYSPASLALIGVRRIWFEEGVYELNSTVVDFEAKPDGAHGDFVFSFDLTGGKDPSSFLVRLCVAAQDFRFGSGDTTAR